MIIINSFRALAVILLLSILIIKDIPFKNLFKDAIIQFYLASVCMLFLLLIDNILGFILSISLLSLYFRIYTSELKSKTTSKEKSNTDITDSVKGIQSKNCSCGKEGCDISNPNNDKCEMNMAYLEKNMRLDEPSPNNNSGNGSVPYITEENLLAAQSNIVNPIEYNRELHGVNKGIYNEDVYGSQGLDTKNIHIRGYDTNSVYLGSLSYDII